MRKLKYPLLLFTLIVMQACGSKKIARTSPVEDAALAAVVAGHYSEEADFNTLQGLSLIHI